jgi:hypothetical protein
VGSASQYRAAEARRPWEARSWGPGALGATTPLRYLTGMPPTKVWATADINAAIEQVAPDVLDLLADGVPRTKNS